MTRLVLIPPYQNPIVKWGWVLREAVANMKKKGQLDGVEVTVDEGYLNESTVERRDEEIKAIITVGLINKVKEYSESGRYDGIVLTGGLGDPAITPARLVSKIPVTGAVHSGFHVASLIGDRFSAIHSFPATCLIIRHYAKMCGFSDKLASVRACRHSTTEMFKLISKYKEDKAARAKDPELKKVIDDITTQCIAAIEKDRADSLILGNETLNALQDEVTQRLDEAGYSEIPVIGNVAAAVEMARAMANMKLVKAPRAYPTVGLKAIPEYW